MRTIIFFGISLIAISAFTFEIMKRENEKKEHHFNWDGIRKEIRDTIIKIDHHDSYDGRITGYNGGESKQYLRIKWLKENVKITEAEELLKYPSTLIQVIIFDKLLARRQPITIEYIKEHRNDSSIFHQTGGCVSEATKLNEHLINAIQMHWNFYPQDSSFLKKFDIQPFEPK